METIAKIRRMYHVEKLGFKTISKALNLSKNTVKKIIREDKSSLKYSRKSNTYPVLAPYKAFLKNALEEDEKSLKKYKRTAKKLFLELQQQGYPGSYDAVHHFVSSLKKQPTKRLAKAYVPLTFEKGEAFQFDWSNEEVILDGTLTSIKIAHIRLCYSRFFLVVAYLNEEMEMVMDAHAKAFEFFGGQPRKGIYDNMKTAVQKILSGKHRVFNRRFLELCSHYCFEPVACTPNAGWEKGQIENQVGFLREIFFSPLRKATDLEDLNKSLKVDCLSFAKQHKHPEEKDKTVFEVYQEEKSFLNTYRSPFKACRIETAVVSSYCLVQHATNSYSVKCEYVERLVKLHIYADEIQIFHEEQCIAKHKRSFERFKKIYDPWHYVPLLERKPGALRNGAPFKELGLPPALSQIRTKLSAYEDGDKQFIKILLEASKSSLEDVNTACIKTLEEGGSSYAMVLHHLKNPDADGAPFCELQAYNQTYLNCTSAGDDSHV